MKYKVIVDKLTYRSSPSINASKKGTLKKGTVITVSEIKTVTETQKSTKKKVVIPWGKFVRSGKTFYISTKGKYMKKVTTDYGELIAAQCLPAAEKVVKNKSKHVAGAYNFEGPKVNCSVLASYILYKAGVLPKGTTVYHTGKNNSKGSIDACVQNYKAVGHMDWHKVNGKFKSLDSKYRVPGCVCVQASNVFIVGNDGLYACHNTGKTYTGLTMIRHTTNSNSYEYTSPVLVVGVPRKE